MFWDKNIKTTWGSYKEWETKQTFEAPNSWKGLEKAKLDRNLFFVFAKTSNARAAQLIDAALKNGKKVCVLDKWKKQLKGRKNVQWVKKFSPEFFQFLFSAGFVYTDNHIHHQYFKPAGQILVVDFPEENRSDFQIRLSMDLIYCKADYLLSKEDNPAEIMEKLAAGSLKRGSAAKSGKKQLLFILNMNYHRMFEYFRQITRSANYDAYEITALFLDKDYEKYANEISRLDTRVHIVLRKGGLIASADTLRKYAFLKENSKDLPPIWRVEKFIAAEPFDREYSRFFGSIKFDHVYNMKFDGVYWRILLPRIHCPKSYYVASMDEVEELEHKLPFLTAHDEILFQSQDICANTLEHNRQLTKKAVAAPVLVSRNAELPQIVDINGKTYLCAVRRQKGSFDTESAVFVPVPEEKYDYVVIPANRTEAECKLLLSELLQERTALYIFDPACVYSSRIEKEAAEAQKKAVYYDSYDEMDALRAYLGKEIPVSNVQKDGQKVCSIAQILP
jgi:hypothetical protein